MGAQTFLLPWKTKEITVNCLINDFVTFNGYDSPLPSHRKKNNQTKKENKTQTAREKPFRIKKLTAQFLSIRAKSVDRLNRSLTV